MDYELQQGSEEDKILYYEQQKTKILTDFFNSGILKIKADGYFKGKLHISRDTKIAEELTLETYYQLARYPAEKLVKVYQENPKSIEAIAVTIMKRQLMHKKPKPTTGSTTGFQTPLSPNNSPGTKLIYGSSYFSGVYISSTDTYTFNESTESRDMHTGIAIADIQDNFFESRDNTPDRWEEIQKRLTPDEIEFITALWNGKRFYKRKPTNSYKEFRDYVFNKIKNMNLNQEPTALQQIQNKLTMAENKMFDVMFDDDLSRGDKIKKLKFSEQQYIAQRRILLKKIKGFNIK